MFYLKVRTSCSNIAKLVPQLNNEECELETIALTNLPFKLVPDTRVFDSIYLCKIMHITEMNSHPTLTSRLRSINGSNELDIPPQLQHTTKTHKTQYY